MACLSGHCQCGSLPVRASDSPGPVHGEYGEEGGLNGASVNKLRQSLPGAFCQG